MYALDAHSGTLFGSSKGDCHLEPPPLSAGAVMKAATVVGGYYALDASTGELLSQNDDSRYFAATVAAIYLDTETTDGLEISAIEGRPGKRIWATNVSR